MKFLHIADLHLGQRHMQLETRYNDFFETLRQIFEHAHKEQVDFIIICGDMFDKKQLDAESLLRTVALLKELQTKGIAVFAIEGNHDQRLFAEHNSFLDYLSQETLLTLLRPTIQDGKEHISSWDEKTRTGAQYTFSKGSEEVMLTGIGYITSSIQEEKLHMLTESLPKEHTSPHIVLMHGSVGGGIPGSIDKELLKPLQKHIDYLALGHWHRKMEIDGWICNPGSMEHTDINRDDISKGYFIVELTKEKKEVCFYESGKRPAVRLTITLQDTHTLEDALLTITEHLACSLPHSTEDIMCKITVKGHVNFHPLELTKKHIEDIIRKTTPLLFLEFENILYTGSFIIEEDLRMEDLSSEQLEKEIIQHLLTHSSEFQEETDLLQRTIHIKQGLLRKEDPVSILSLLE